MSKRCCAKNCFNSVLYNRNIAYFSFPKNKQFAHRWAELAGRTDIMEKPLSRIVKYYLCSEHFTANSFVDKDTRLTLKRNLPHSIALPSIFKNNLQETMQNANPRQSIEVHNIILLDVDERLKGGYQSASNENTLDCCSQRSIPIDEKRDDFFTCDDMENQYFNLCQNEMPAETPKPLSTTTEKPPLLCRLCCNQLKCDEPMIRLEDSIHLKEFIGRVMHNQIAIGDDMSQIVCKNCEKNALLCLIIIQQMDTAQEKIVLQENK